MLVFYYINVSTLEGFIFYQVWCLLGQIHLVFAGKLCVFSEMWRQGGTYGVDCSAGFYNRFSL